MEDLKQLANSDKSWAATRAQLAIKFCELHDNNQINTSEYQELLQDLIRTDVLESEADDIETKALLVSAITTLSKLV